MGQEEAPTSFAEHRRRLIARGTGRVAMVILSALAIYFVADVVTEGLQAPDVIYYGAAASIAASVWFVVYRLRPHRPERWILPFAVAFVAVICSRMAVPTTTVSGTALMVSLVLLGAALAFPWPPRFQGYSVIGGLSAYALFFCLRFWSYDEPFLIHQLFGPLLAGVLSVWGASALDRARRELFERTQRLSESESRLQVLLGQRERDAKAAEALARVGRVVVQSLNRPAMLENLARESAAILESDFVHVLRYEAEGDEYVVSAGYGDPPEMWEAIRVLRFPREFVALVQSELDRTGVVQSGPSQEEPLIDPGIQTPFAVTMTMVVPLVHEGRPLGLLSAGFRGRTEPFSPHQVRVAQGIARVASLGLTNAALYEQLDRANRVKADFVASMSHELRTPLNVIIGYQDMLSDREFGPLTEAQSETLERLQRHSRQLLDLISATLDLSRLEAGRVDVEHRSVDVAAFLEALRRDAAETWSDDAVEFHWEWSADLPSIESDRVKLEVVVKNLISNAVKFAKGGNVWVRAQRDAAGVEISVADDGIGIDAEAQARIFEPFQQANASIGFRFGGVGLGLHIVRRLVELLAGRISVESTVGEGATFRVWLPDETAQQVASDPATLH